jgi:hypothetical protein
MLYFEARICMQQVARLNQLIRQKPLWFAFILTIVLQCLVWVLYTPRYETNDDLFMNGIVSGFWNGTPDPHLPYSHFLIGYLLSGLFQWSVAWNWYAAYLAGTHLLSWLIIFSGLAQKPTPLIGLLFSIGLFVFFEPLFYTQLQFTTTATLAGIAGMVLVNGAFEHDRVQRKKLLGGILMLLYASMIRESSAYLAILLCSIALVNFSNRKRMVQPLLLIAGLFVLIAALQFLNKLILRKRSSMVGLLSRNKKRAPV